jgi:hypothetical protein
MNELTVIGLLICALGIGLFVASVRAARKMDPDTPDLPRIEVRDDLRNLPTGSIVTVSYDALLNMEQRQALKSSIEYQVGEGVKVIVLEAGIRIDVQTENEAHRAFWEKVAADNHEMRRRDDNRPHEKPSEPWN